MSVRQQSKHEMVTALRERYWAASRSERGQLLDTLVEVTGFHRKYALPLLWHGVPAKRPMLRRRGRPTCGLEVIAAWSRPSLGVFCSGKLRSRRTHPEMNRNQAFARSTQNDGPSPSWRGSLHVHRPL